MAKWFLLTVCFLTINSAEVLAQVFNPTGETKPVASEKVSPKKSNTSTKKIENDEAKKSINVVKQFKKTLENEDKYDNSQRKVYSLKMVNGKIVANTDAPRSILISYGNYSINRSFDSLPRCSIRVYVLNDLMHRITNFSFKLHWPDVSTTVQMNRLNPGVRTYKDIMLLGDGCFHLDKVPTIEVNRCRVKGMSQEDCANAVVWYQGQ